MHANMNSVIESYCRLLINASWEVGISNLTFCVLFSSEGKSLHWQTQEQFCCMYVLLIRQDIVTCCVNHTASSRLMHVLHQWWLSSISQFLSPFARHRTSFNQSYLPSSYCMHLCIQISQFGLNGSLRVNC